MLVLVTVCYTSNLQQFGDRNEYPWAIAGAGDDLGASLAPAPRAIPFASSLKSAFDTQLSTHEPAVSSVNRTKSPRPIND